MDKRLRNTHSQDKVVVTMPGYLLSVFIVSALTACAGQPPPCNTEINPESLQGNAGCWLVKDGKVLMVEQRNGSFSFPGGTANAGESAQCTAHRETMEEAGVNVRVGRLKHQFDNGFYLFNCEAENITLTTNDALEVAGVVLVDPSRLPVTKWRFPDQRQLAIEWLSSE